MWGCVCYTLSKVSKITLTSILGKRKSSPGSKRPEHNMRFNLLYLVHSWVNRFQDSVYKKSSKKCLESIINTQTARMCNQTSDAFGQWRPIRRSGTKTSKSGMEDPADGLGETLLRPVKHKGGLIILLCYSHNRSASSPLKEDSTVSFWPGVPLKRTTGHFEAHSFGRFVGHLFLGPKPGIVGVSQLAS